MKIAVISDIHANLPALNATLKFLSTQKIDRIICLGDIVGYGPYPNECIELVKEHCQYVMLGNHDQAALGMGDVNYFNEYALEVILWTRERLTAYNKGFLENLPYSVSDDKRLYVHSSPFEPEEWHYILDEHEARANLACTDAQLIFIGHSHIPLVFSEREGFLETELLPLELKRDRYIVNVGSIGQPRNGDPRATFVIYDDQSDNLEYIRINYDVDEAFQAIIDSHLPSFLAMRLLTGQ